jgi:hypothetical protein
VVRKRSIHSRLEEIKAKLPPKPDTAAEAFTEFLWIQQQRDEERYAGLAERPPGHEVLTREQMYRWVRGWMEQRGEDPDVPFEDYPPTTEGEG